MASAGRGRGRNIRENASEYYSNIAPLPHVVAPMGSVAAMNDNVVSNDTHDLWRPDDDVDWDDEQRTSEQDESTAKTGLEYTYKYIQEENIKINKIKLDGTLRNESKKSENLNREEFGHGHGRRNHEGNRTNQRYANSDRSRRLPEPSIYGTIPDKRVDDTEVYLKYDFTRRVFDTSGLVINGVRDKIMTNLVSHQIMTIEGFTGCGKTTQVPQFILDDAERNKRNCRIAVTQPRRIAAISVANRVASERNWRVGGIVGYQVGMNKQVSDDTRLMYMTTGVLLQLLISKKRLQDFTHIIIDEVHERDLETDLLLLVIKKIMVDTKDDRTRVVLMSATLNPEKFTGYFPMWETGQCSGKSINVKVDHPNQYPVKELYLEEAAASAGQVGFTIDNFEEPKVYQECLELAAKIVESLDQTEASNQSSSNTQETRGAVLVFLPGLMEIELLYKILGEFSAPKRESDGSIVKKNPKWSVLPLHSTITNEEQQRVFIPAKKGYRKIILATNIAESSITVPDIKYVIDFCLTKNLSCDPSTNFTCLRLEWASKNQCIQRRGRCGRVAPGVVFRMVSKKFYNTLEQEARPEMLRSSLESVVLQVKLLDMGSPKSILALAVDPPEINNIQRAVSNLKEIGAMTINTKDKYDAYDGELTFVGRVLTRLPIDIRFGRLILLGHAFGCLEEAVVIAAGLSVKSPFAYPYSRRLDAYLSKLNWTTKSFSDCISLLNLYEAWFKRHQHKVFATFPDEKKWAKTYFVQLTSLREMKLLIDELYKRLQLCGIEVIPSSKTKDEQALLLKLVIAGGFYPSYFTRTRPNARDYQKEINREVAGKDPFASVVFQGFPLEQPGALYKKIIGNYVMYQTCIPQIEFHGSRVVVTFDARGNYMGPISMGVYRAIKQRQLRYNLTIGTPSRDLAYKMLNDKILQMEAREYLPAPPQEAMPGLRVDALAVVVTNVETPSEFYVVQQCHDATAVMISNTIKANEDNLFVLKKEQCQLGQICATIQQGKYLRARIEADRNNCDQILLFFIDRGISRWTPRTQCLGFAKPFFETGIHQIPGLAIQCRLKELRASVRTDCIWTAEAITVFRDYTDQNSCLMVLEIYGIAESIISGVIRNPKDPAGSPSINEILLEKKYAEKCSESDGIRDNYTIRERMKHQDANILTNLKTFEDRQNKSKVPERLLDPPKFTQDSEPDQQVALRGPHNPLEMTFTALCGSAHLKQVVTDGSSVNSVTLDPDPTNPSSRLMVAANVAIAQRSGNILARETTIMPPIPGLTGLLAMLFCPKIEFRVDENKTCYTGCLTGLGIDPVTKDSVYSDHDMEVVFDTVIDNHDVNLVNSIRSGMNSILSDKVSQGPNSIRNIRDRMRKEALSLLERERSSMEEIWPEQTHQWTCPEESELITTVNRRSARDSGAVFPLHEPLQFNEGVEPSANRNMYF